jgi:branched-chain amino acid transport system substrate-binding protein
MASISDIDPKELFERVGPTAARYVVLSQSMPNPLDESRPMVADFRHLVRQAGGKLQANAYALEGYVQARVIVEGLRRSSDPGPAALAQALETIRGLDLGGYYISFGTNSHEGASFVDTTIISESGRVRH